MWTIILTVVLVALLLFVVIKASQASVNIKQANYDDAYKDTNIIAISSGILLAIAIVTLVIHIYLTFRKAPVSAIGSAIVT